jgi:16S rRNA (guanine1207-N2)-methyltransferase
LSHYFTNDEVKSDVKTIKSIINEREYAFYTDNNLFSKDKIDFGTKLLLESITNIYGNVLDLGCGYGVIGIYLRSNYDVKVDMIDVNKRAIALANKNIELHNLNNINAFESDGYKNIVSEYDYIVTNPPIRIGKEKLYNLLISAKDHLKKEGKLILVIRKEQGAKSLNKELEKIYSVKIINKKKGYCIITAEK